jgi:hypothetical protein
MPAIPRDNRTLPNHVRLAQAHLRIKRPQAKAAQQDFLQELKERIATRKTSSSLLPLPQALKIINIQLESTQRFRRHIQHALGNNRTPDSSRRLHGQIIPGLSYWPKRKTHSNGSYQRSRRTGRSHPLSE